MRLRYIPTLLLLFFCLPFFSQNTTTNNVQSTNNVISTSKIYKLKEVDYAPIFSKGKMSQKDFLKIYLKYPLEAQEKGIEGTVILAFIVSSDGEVTSPSILQGDHTLLNQEAIRIASLIPYYTPGYYNDVPVSTQILFPVTFTLPTDQTTASIIPLTADTTAITAPQIQDPVVLQAHLQPVSNNGSPDPIYIINGKMIDSNIDLDANKIESIRVIKGSKALQLYGPGAKDGVIIITTKLYPDTKSQ